MNTTNPKILNIERVKYISIVSNTNGIPDKKSNKQFYPPKKYNKYENARLLNLSFAFFTKKGKLVKSFNEFILPEEENKLKISEQAK